MVAIVTFAIQLLPTSEDTPWFAVCHGLSLLIKVSMCEGGRVVGGGKGGLHITQTHLRHRNVNSLKQVILH